MRELLGPGERATIIKTVAESGYWSARKLKKHTVSIRKMRPYPGDTPYLAAVVFLGQAKSKFCASVFEAVEWISTRIELAPLRNAPLQGEPIQSPVAPLSGRAAMSAFFSLEKGGAQD